MQVPSNPFCHFGSHCCGDAIAQAARFWGVLSKKKVESTIDVLVDYYDPGALTHTRTSVRGRGIGFGNADAGTTEISGRPASSDAALVDRRLTAMATAVCDGDPRTFEQRRADAMGAFGAGNLASGVPVRQSAVPEFR